MKKPNSIRDELAKFKAIGRKQVLHLRNLGYPVPARLLYDPPEGVTVHATASGRKYCDARELADYMDSQI